MQTIGLFISEWDGRCDWLQTTAEHDIVWSIWTGDHGELSFSHLNGEWLFHAKSHELIDASLSCPPDWAQGPPVLHAERGLSLPGCRTIVPVLRILFSRLKWSFQLLWGNSFNSLRAPYRFDGWRCFKSESHLSVKFLWYLGLNSFPRQSRCTK